MIFTINTQADYIQNVEESVQLLYNADSSSTTHNLIDSDGNHTSDFNLAASVSFQAAPSGQIVISDILENSTLSLSSTDILSLISDPNNDTLNTSSITSLSIAATSNATVALGSSTLTGPVSDTWTFSPGDFFGEVQLTAVVNDGNSGGALSTTFTSTFNVLPVNDAPVQSSSATLSSVARGQNKDITLSDLLGNITDTETTQLSGTLTSDLSIVGNSVSTNKGTITYDSVNTKWVYNSTSTNSAGDSITDSGSVTLSYVVTDGTNQVSASATFTVDDTNAAPTGYIEFSDILENSILKFTSADILNRISDPNADTLNYASITSLTIVDNSNNSSIPNGSLLRQDDTSNNLSNFTFSPAEFTGVAKISAVVEDGNGGSTTFTTTFNVLSVNDDARFNSSDSVSPTLLSASLSSADSKSISLYFSESLDNSIVIENNTFVVKDSNNATLSYTVTRDTTDYSSNDSVITLVLDSAISDTNNLTVSYSGSSIVDASSANSYAGNALSAFSNQVVSNTRVNSPLIISGSLGLDGKTLTLNSSKALDSTDVISSSTFTVQSSTDGSNWVTVPYSVDGDSSDYINTASSIVLKLDDALMYSHQVRVSYASTTIEDSSQTYDLATFSNFSIQNRSSVFTLESLASTNSVIYEDLGFDGTPTTAQIISLAAEGTVNPDSVVVGNYYTIESVGSTDWTAIGASANAAGTTFKATNTGTGNGTASTNYLILDSEILGKYYDVESSALSLYNVVADNGTFKRNDANTGWFYRPVVNYSGQVVVSFDVFDGTSFTPGSATLDVQSINDIPVRIAGNVSGIIIPEGASTDTSPPTLAHASVNGSSVLLHFSEALDTSTVVNSSMFDIKVGGNEVTYTVNGSTADYSKSNTTLSLTLSSAVSATDVVTIDFPSYTRITSLGTTTNWTNHGAVQTAAGNFVVGREYIINTAGDTSFTGIGATNNNVGTVFIATGAGSGSGNALETNFVATSSITGDGVSVDNVLKDTAFSANKLVAFSGSSISNITGTDTTVPVLTSALLAPDGKSVKLVFSEPLDTSVSLNNSTFNVKMSADGVNYSAHSYSIDATSAAYSDGDSTISLTFATAVDYQALLTLDYQGTNIKDTSGNALATIATASPMSIKNNVRVSLGLSALSYLPGLGDDESINSSTIQTLTYKITALPSSLVGQLQLIDGTPVVLNDTYSIDQLRQLQFESFSGANGTTSFTINIADSAGSSINEVIPIGTSFVNDGPIQTGPAFVFSAVQEDNTLDITKAQLLTGYVDEEGNPMFVNGLSASNGTLSQSGDTWTFTPIEHFVGTVDLMYVINDSNGGGILATNSFQITEVNDAPVRDDGSSFNTLTVLEDGPVSSMNLPSTLSYSTGGEGRSTGETSQSLTYTVTSLPVTGGGASAGTIYKDNGTSVAAGSFVSGTKYYISASGTTDFTQIGAANNNVGTSFTATGAGAGTGEAVAITTVDLSNPSLTLTELKGLKFQPAANIVGTFTLGFTVSDDGPNTNDGNVKTDKNSLTQSVGISILNFNDTPVLPTPSIAFTSNGTEDTAFTFTEADFLAGVTDPDLDSNANPTNPFGDVLSISNLSASNGTLIGPVNGVYTFTPSANFNSDLGGVVTFNYLINDGQGGSIANTITRTIDPGNDSPVATFNTAQFASENGGTLTGQLTATDIELSRGDNAGKTLTYTQTNTVAGFALAVDGSGSFTFDTADTTYRYLALNETLTLTINYQVTDEVLGTNFGSLTAQDLANTKGSFTITLTGSNDDPYAVGGALAALTPGTEDTTSTFTIADLTQGYADYDTSDVLTVQSPTAYKVVDGVTTDEIVGSFTPNLVNNILQSYTYQPSANFTGNLEVKYVVSDSKGPGIAGSSTLVINAVNDTPVPTFAFNQSASEAGAVVTGQLTADDTEITTGEQAATSLTYSLVGDAIAGLTIAADGQFTFDPTNAAYEYLANGEEQVITVNYRVTDPGNLFADKSFTITINGTNDNVVVDLNAIATLAAATEDTAFVVSIDQLLQGFSDVDTSDVLVVQGLTAFKANAAGTALDEVAGTLTRVETNGVLTGYQFTPVANYNGNVALKYTVVDGNGSDIAGSLVLNVNAVNDIPVPSFGINQVTYEADTLVTGQLTADDIEIGTGEQLATSLIYTLSGNAIPGFAIANDGAFTFDPTNPAYEYLAAGEEQVITVNYRVTDAGGLFAEKNFTFTVKGTNDDPVVDLGAIAALAAATEDTPYTVSVDQLLQGFSDVDTSDVLVVQGLTAFKADAAGNALDDGAGTISRVEVNGVLTGYQFTPLDNYNGNVILKYTVADGNGPGRAGSLPLIVNAVNDLPVPTYDTNLVNTEGNELVTGQLTAVDNEIITGEQLPTSLTYTLSGNAIPGLTIAADGAFTFNPQDAAYDYLAFGEEQIINVNYRVTDAGALFAEKTFTITVKGTNDDPVVDVNQTVALAAATEDTEYLITTADLLAGYSDVDTTDVLTVESLVVYKADNAGLPTTELGGSVTPVVVNGVTTGYNLLPADDYFGDVVVTYIVSDGNGPGVPATSTITVNPVVDVPRVGNLGEKGLNLGQTPEDTPTTFTTADLLAGFTDPDGFELTIKPDSVTNAYSTITLEGDTYTFTPNLNFSGSTQIDFTVVDAAGNEVPFSKFIDVIEVNDPPSITLDRDALDSDYKSKTYLIPFEQIFAVVPANPVVELIDPDLSITTQVVGDSLSIEIPAAYTEDVSFMFGDTVVDPNSLFTLDVLRPLQVSDRNVVAGFERFFALSDFGFGDVEGLPLQSVLIQVPDTSLGTIRVGSGNFDTDTENVIQLTPLASSDFNQSNVFEVTREQIETGSVYFVANPSPLNAGKSADLEFIVKDESGDLSTLPGLLRITIQEAPESVQDFIANSTYEPIFDAELGLNRFDSVDTIISSIGITRDEALSVIRSTLPIRTAANSFDASVETPFSYVTQNEVEYRWDIGAFDIFEYDFTSNTQTLVLDFASLTIDSDLYQHFADLYTYSLANDLDNAYLASKLVELIPGSNDRLNKIEDAFSLSNYDDIYSYLTASGRNGPELLDITTDNTQKQFVRLYSAIASSPILSNTFNEGRDLLVQSVLDLINPPSPLPNRLVDNLNDLFTEKTSSLASSFVLPSGIALSPEGLDRLNRVTNLVGTGGSSDLLAASEFSTNTPQLLNTLSDQNIISDTGSLLNNFGQPVLSDGEPLIISDYQSLVSSFVDTNLTTFSDDFLENDSISGELARNIVLNEISERVVQAADSSTVPEVISSTLNNLLAAALQLDPVAEDAKTESNRLLKMALSVDSLVEQRPLYEVDEATGQPKTVFDPRSNTDVFVVNEENQAFYNAALEQQDVLQADYVGLTLEQWKDIDNQPNSAKVKADRINAVKIGISYADYLNFANLNPLDSEVWSIYPFVGYVEAGTFDSDDFLVVDNLFVDPQAALNNLISSGINKGVSFDDFSSLLFNQPIYTPSTVSSDSGAEITRADAITYASTDPSSALYIAAMDSNFQEGNVIKAYKTTNPNPYKFTIEDFDDANLLTDGLQVSYLVNYTYGDLAVGDSGYTFNVASGYSPDLVGHDLDEFNLALKYVSEYDLLSYGATPVESSNDLPVEPGQQVFTWESNPENIIDKYGQQSAPLYDLDGRVITKAGWYDFTLRPTTETEFDPELEEQVPVWRDGARFIYADYYTVDVGNFLTDNDPANDELLIPANSWYVPSQSDLLEEEEGVLPEGVAFRRIVGLELNFTDNAFGDKDPGIGRVVDPFGTGAKSNSSSLFTSNFTSDNLFNEEPPDPKFILKRNEKKVLKTAVVLDETKKAVDLEAVVLDETQKAVDLDAVLLEDDQVAVSRDLLVTDELFTSDVDMTNLRLVDENAVILALNEKTVDIDAVILEDDQIAISRDILVTDELFTSDVDLTNLRLVDEDAVVLEPTQKAVDIDDVVLLDNQIAVDDDAVILDPTEKAVDINAIILLDDQVAFNIDDVPVSLDGLKLVPDDAVVLDPNQQAVDVNTEILQPDQKAVPLDAPEVANDASGSGKYKQPPSDIKQSGSGVDAPGISDIAALKFGEDAPGTGNGDGNGQGAGSSNSSGSGVGVSMNEQATQFPEGEGDGDSDSVEQRGQGAPGQGDGEGGEAALGDDQTPTTQRKRGLMLQPIVESESVDEDAKSSSNLLKNLSEGSIMGTNLLDALTLGGGILYALYAPQAVKPIKRTFGSLLGRLTGRSTSIPERKVATVFAMKLPDGTQRLIAAKVTTQSIDIIAQQDMPSGMSVTQAGNQEQVDFAFNQLLDKITNESFDLMLVGPRLRNQISLVAKLASDSLILDTSSIEQKLKSCSQDEVKSLQQWLDRPSSTPPESNPVKDLLSVRQSDYSKSLMTQQASMASLVELSVALSWKD